MADPEWLMQAKTLSEGRSRKVVCCGNSPSMIVSHKREGYHAWCFRCQEPGLWRSHENRSIAELIAARAARELITQPSQSCTLPGDFQDAQSVPSSMMTWMWKAGIDRTTAAMYGIGWSPRLRRVVLPVYDQHGQLQMWQGRSTSETLSPKYLNVSNATCSNVFSSRHLKPHSGRSQQLRCDDSLRLPVVIVEDILSAIRVNCAAHGMALLGTALRPEGLNAIRAAAKRGCILWTDGDSAGRKANRSLKSTIALLGLDVGQIRTPKDPKLYSNNEIKEFIMKAKQEMTC